MTPENFCYWLQGYFEISRNETLSKENVSQIKEHLELVFKKETSVFHVGSSYALPSIYENPQGKGRLTCSLGF